MIKLSKSNYGSYVIECNLPSVSVVQVIYLVTLKLCVSW